MELVDVLRYALGIIGVLVLIFCGAVWAELLKLRASRHEHANRITEFRMALSLVCRKVGINPKTYEDEE